MARIPLTPFLTGAFLIVTSCGDSAISSPEHRDDDWVQFARFDGKNVGDDFTEIEIRFASSGEVEDWKIEWEASEVADPPVRERFALGMARECTGDGEDRVFSVTYEPREDGAAAGWEESGERYLEGVRHCLFVMPGEGISWEARVLAPEEARDPLQIYVNDEEWALDEHGGQEEEAANERPGTPSIEWRDLTTETTAVVGVEVVDDGTGEPASYDIRYTAPGGQWENAVSVSEGSCATPLVVEGAGLGDEITCTIEGLERDRSYDVQAVAFRGSPDEDPVSGDPSNRIRVETGVEHVPEENFRDSLVTWHVRGEEEFAFEDEFVPASKKWKVKWKLTGLVDPEANGDSPIYLSIEPRHTSASRVISYDAANEEEAGWTRSGEFWIDGTAGGVEHHLLAGGTGVSWEVAIVVAGDACESRECGRVVEVEF